MSTDTNDIYYVGNRVGVDDVDVLNKNEITKNLVIPTNDNALLVGAVTVTGTVTVEGTLVIV